ncbi:MAG: hypothetical protein QOC68_2052 [Solirubrobacteraceae bacterium]|nr:hypothetical protein [Solirubrobacteraceae bacterium]
MTATLRPREPAAAPARPAPPSAPAARTGPGDGVVVACLLAALTLVAVLTWQKWGSPEIDAGAELSTADLVSHGAIPYEDVRYFYGPLGLYGLALIFKILGTSYAAAFAFGLAQTVAILAVFYVLARQWLRPLAAGAATAVMIAVAFSGTAFDFVLPHTNSATMGILFLLVTLLALKRGWIVGAGLAAGLVGLTRPEFAAIEAGMLAAYLVGAVREAGWRPALRDAGRLALPAVLVAGGVLAVFAALAGTSNLFTENLWPVDFMRVAGFRSQAYWMPFDLPSAVALAARGLLYGAGLAAIVGAAVVWRARTGAARLQALLPPAAALVGVALLDLLARKAGAVPATRVAIETEVKHLLIGLSALPAVIFAVGAWTLVRFRRRERSPLGGGWAVDLALIAAASAFALRAYNAFTPEGSYAPYYAAPLVLVAAILHDRVGDRWPAARVPALAALGAVAVGLLAYSIHGIYGDESATVRTPRGAFVTQPAAAAPLSAVVRRVDRDTAPGDRLLAAPSEGGLYFMTDRRPALNELMLLPGLLDTRADEVAAVARLRAEGVREVVIAARDYGAYGSARFGVDFNRTLGGYLTGATRKRMTFGSLTDPAGGTYPSRGFTVLRLSG